MKQMWNSYFLSLFFFNTVSERKCFNVGRDQHINIFVAFRISLSKTGSACNKEEKDATSTNTCYSKPSVTYDTKRWKPTLWSLSCSSHLKFLGFLLDNPPILLCHLFINLGVTYMGPQTYCVDLRTADFIVTNVCSIVRGCAKAHNSYQLWSFSPQVTIWNKWGQ